MTGETKKCWTEFVAYAAEERDPEKLIELVRKINLWLDDQCSRPLAQKSKEQCQFPIKPSSP